MSFAHVAEIVKSEAASFASCFGFKLLRLNVERQLFNGQVETLPYQPLVFERGDSGAVLLYDPQKRCIYLTYQFRAPTLLRPQVSNGWVYEVMAGKIETGENGAHTIKREALEELGVELGKVAPICRFFVSPGGCSEVIYLYAAEIVRIKRRNKIGGLVHEGEDILRVEVPYHQAIEMVENGTIMDAKTIIAIQWLAQQLS